MGRFLLKRLLQAIVTLFVVSTIIFFLVRVTGNPVDMMTSPDATEEQRAEIKRSLGLDDPLPVQYFTFITDIGQGDFGDSIRYRQPVMDLVRDRLPYSVLLAMLALFLAFLIGVPLGVIAAVNKGTYVDHGARMLAVFGIGFPSFLTAILLTEYVSVKWGWLPVSGTSLQNYILPGFTLALFGMAAITRLVRSSLLEVLDTEFIKLARLKGVSERRVIWRHALRNSLIPVVSLTGVTFARLITVAVVVETIFNWPGIGRLSYEAILYRDFPLIQAVVLVAAALVVVANFLVDMSYAYLDPRIRRR